MQHFPPSTSVTVIAEFLNFPSDYYSIKLFMYIINGQRNSGNYDKCSRSEHLSLPKQRISKTNFKICYSVKHCGLFFECTCLYIDIRYFHWDIQLPNYSFFSFKCQNIKVFLFSYMQQRKKESKEKPVLIQRKKCCCHDEFQVILWIIVVFDKWCWYIFHS